MSNFGDVFKGLARVLENKIFEMLVIPWPVDTVNHFPAAVVVPEPVDVEVNLQGNTFEGRLRMVVLVASGDSAEGFDKLWDYLDPTEVTKSVVAAVRADQTLDGKVDDADVERIENIGRRELWGGWYFAFDAIVHFIKTVA